MTAFEWVRNPFCKLTYTNLFAMFRPAPRIFAKLSKVLLGVFRRVSIRIIIYLDAMLSMGRTLQEIPMARDTLIFLLEHLAFVINLKDQ